MSEEIGVTLNLPSGLDPETARLVHLFAEALGRKLYKAQQKYGYRNGWAMDNWETECRAQLRAHMRKGDPRDVAAYCAFMWRHGWSTSASAAAIRRAERIEAENANVR